jgi:hypothetical protein
VKEANRYLRSRHRRAGDDARTDGTIQIHGEPEDGKRFAAAVEARMRGVYSMTPDDMHALIREMAPQFNVRVGQEARPHLLPEPWRTYLSAELHTLYVTGCVGEQPFVGTFAWSLVVPESIVAMAERAGFQRINLPADYFGVTVSGPHPIVLPEPGVEDDAIVEVGDRLFNRSVLAPLVLQGAVEGWLMSNQMLLCPGIGAAMPLGE